MGDWREVAGIPEVDEIATDPYWQPGTSLDEVERMYRHSSRLLCQMAGEYKKEAQIWILNCHVKKGGEDRVRRACRVSFEERIRNVFAWSYRGSKWMSALACDNPDLVWNILGEEFKLMRDKV